MGIKRIVKRVLPDRMLPHIRRVYQHARRIASIGQDIRDAIQLERADQGQHPRVYLPIGYSRVHNIWRTYATHPPLAYVSEKRAELCHWLNRVPHHPAKPCVAECEHILALAGDITNWQWGLQRITHINQLVEQSELKYIFTYSAGLVAHSRKYLRPDLWSKLGYVYPAYPIQSPSTPILEAPFTILVIASRFSDKGVPEAIEAFRILRQRHGADIAMTIVCQVIPDNYALVDGITHFDVPRMSDQLKLRLFTTSHAMLIPCYSDTSVPIMEALSFGTPTISTRIHNGDEYVKDGVTGYLINTPVFSYSDDYGIRWKYWEDFLRDLDMMRTRGELRVVSEQIVERVEHMMQHPAEVAQMRINARQMHAQHFAPEVRNRQLLDIYNQALYGVPNQSEVKA